MVNFVGGNGGLASFTLVWPVPAIIMSPNLSYAYDDTSIVFKPSVTGDIGYKPVTDGPNAVHVDTIADAIANILKKFREQLAAANEASCSVGGATVAIADNTVLVTVGDTPKNAFNKAGWSDASVVTWAYVSSNGFLKPGWFGQVLPAGSAPYDVDTGNVVASSNYSADQTAGRLGVLYAITRGNTELVSALSTASYQALVK